MPRIARAEIIVLALLLLQRRTVRVFLLTVLTCSLFGLIRAPSLLLRTDLFDQHLVGQKGSAALCPLISRCCILSGKHDQIWSYLPWNVFLEHVVEGCKVLLMSRDNLLLLDMSRCVCRLRYLLL